MPKACFVVGVTVTDLAKRKAFDKCYQAICLTTNEMDNAPMSTLFASCNHLCAFTLVAAIAIEFTLIRPGCCW